MQMRSSQDGQGTKNERRNTGKRRRIQTMKTCANRMLFMYEVRKYRKGNRSQLIREEDFNSRSSQMEVNYHLSMINIKSNKSSFTD